MEALVLSYFDTIIGPIITHVLNLGRFKTLTRLPLDLRRQIQRYLDSELDEGFFFHSFKKYQTANVYFLLRSGWARGNNEMLCLSLLIKSRRPEQFKETLEAGVARLRAIPCLFKAFYHEKKTEDEDIEKKRQDLKESLNNLCQDVLRTKNESIVQCYRSDRDAARDSDRDAARDRDRDAARDRDRKVMLNHPSQQL